MICPSDSLEPIIHNRFEGQKYFYTSLGNSLSLDQTTLEEIVDIIKKNKVNEIIFILSEDNSIVLDFLNNRMFFDINGLSETYNHLLNYKKHLLSSWGLHNQQTMVLSYHLNERIKELRSELHPYLSEIPEMRGKLFSKAYNGFRNIHSELVCIDSKILN